MTPNQQKGFFSNHRGHTHGQDYNGGIAQSNKGLSVPGIVIVWILRKAALVIEKLTILAKYQFYKHTAVVPSTVNVPWTKLSVVGALAFMSFKQDLSFTVGMNGAHDSKFGSTPIVEKVTLKNDRDDASLLPFFSSKKLDHFAEAPSDNAKDRAIKRYIRRFKDVAIVEREKFGIPASIKMAQAIVESNSGQSVLSTKNNNHFGIKCFSKTCRKGHCSNFGDDSHKDFFRKYDSAWESWRAHSKMIVSGRYKPLLEHGNDYKKWAKGLKKLGYATAKHYEQTLVEMIEKYNLHTLDEV